LKKIIISSYKNRLFSACLQDRKIQYLEFEEDSDHLLNRIYVAKVKNVVNNINACFVEYEKGKLAFLPFNSIRPETIVSANNNDRLIPVAGDDVLIQIIKAPHKTKEATASGSIRIDGRKVNLKTHEIYRVAKMSTVFSCIYQPDSFYIDFIRKYSKIGYTDIDTDIEAIYQDIYEKFGIYEKTELISDKNDSVLLPILPRRERKFHCNDDGLMLSYHFKDDISLFSLYGLNASFDEIFFKNVWLKCGGYLVIEPTEALVSIDVNSGKAVLNKTTEESRLLINLQAVEEAARQIRLRNLSGMILIDLINMEYEESYRLVIEKIKEELSKDSIKSEFYDITALGIAEIVRKKTTRPYYELFLS